MAKICLSPTSTMGRLVFDRKEITREISCEVSAVKGLMKTQDPNLSVVFEEGDREELSNLDDRMVLEVVRMFGMPKDSTAENVVDFVLPKPVVEKISIPKSAKRGAKKAAKKVKEIILPEAEIVTEEVEEPTEIVDSE